MKKLTNLILVMIPYLFYACSESESIAPRQPLPNDPSTAAVAAFESTTATVKEDDAIQQTIAITLSKSALAEGTLVIKLSPTNSVYGVDFETFPAAINGEINLPVAKGDVSISFGIKPIQNTDVNSARSVEFTMARATGGVAATTNAALTLEIKDDEVAPAVASFQATAAELKENDNQQIIIIPLLKLAPDAGTLIIKLSSTTSTYGVDFETLPAALNGEIKLPVAKGDVSISFGIKPIQNTVFNSARSVEFTMAHATGGVATTPNSYFTLELQDDELAGRLKKYESVSGSWRTSRAFTYDGQGELNGIIWSQHTPLPKTGSYTYHRENGKVVRMTDQFGFVTNYEWREGRVVKSERIEMERLKQRIEYSYDDAGNVGEMVFYDRQPDGSLQRSMVMVFLYFLDGNIYKKLTYYVGEGQEPTLSSTETFENYLEKPNPAPMVETLPHLNPQPNLPRTYRLEIGGQTLEYGIQYQLRSDGLPTKRTLQGLSTIETTSYSYY